MLTRRPQVRRIVRFIAVGTAVLATAVTLPATSSAQPRPSVSEVAARVDALNEQAEAITEAYNKSKITLRAAQRSAGVADERVARAEKALAVQKAQLATIASSAYRNVGISGSTALMISSNPKDFLGRATALNRLSAHESDRLRALRVASVRVADAKAEAKARLARVTKINTELAAQKRNVVTLLNRAMSMLAGLRADERTRLAALRAQQARATRNDIRDTFTGPASARARVAIDFAMSQRGKPYHWGSSGPSSYDCSGLTMAAFRRAGISLDHYTGSQWNAGRHVSRSQLRPGDLVFFYNDHHHVGIYIGGGQMVHAPHTGDVVKVSPIDGRQFSGAVRLVG